MDLAVKWMDTDFLIVGGGAAGCYAALTFCKHTKGRVLLAEKANIQRSGCLAAGVNALNAYITAGKTPQDYVDYARQDAEGIVRGDLLRTMAEGLNRTVSTLESLGLTILKDRNGKYVARGTRNIKINGENIKPLLARAVAAQTQVTVLNEVNVFDYIVKDGRVWGAYAVGVKEPVLYVLSAKAVLCATGGASGLYRPNHPGFSRHKMWYPPFNTGAGYAMGIRAGAEMTTLEMRFIALRVKDTIAPTGTLAQGVGAKQINALGEVYEQHYGLTTSQRVYGTVQENLAGRGPCCLRTEGISAQQDLDLQKAYLNMAPGQTLRWLESGQTPRLRNVEIEGTEPYIVGGHTASGYWVDTDRQTTLRGLFAAGDVAGGCPQKYVTGAFAEGEISAKAAAASLTEPQVLPDAQEVQAKKDWIASLFDPRGASAETDALEEAMQAVMDEYAGGIQTQYRFSEASLQTADKRIGELQQRAKGLKAAEPQEVVYILELLDRLTLCRAVIAHLRARRETRWHSFAEYTDYPQQDPAWDLYVNSRMKNGKLEMVFRPLVKEQDRYEHFH